jgi:hypothetical protein
VSPSKNRHCDNNNSIYDIDEKIGGELKSSLSSILEKKKGELRKLKDVKTLIDCYKKTREHKQQIDEQGVLSFVVNKITQELLKQVEPYYVGSIVRNIEIQTRIKKEDGDTVELNAKIDFDASLKPYVEFTIEVNKKKSYLVRFRFQIDTSAHVRKLRFTDDADKGKSIHIEKLEIEIELSLLQMEFSDLIASSSQISFNKKMKLGSKSFEIHDLSLYSRDVSSKKESMVCPECNTINPLGSKYCTNCSISLL